MFDFAVIEHSSLVELDAPTMDCSGKGYLIGVKVLPARFSLDLVWRVAQDILDRF